MFNNLSSRMLLIVAVAVSACSPNSNDVQPDRPHPEINRAFEQDRSDWSPLHEATLAGDLPGVRELVEAGADIRAENPGSHWTALHIAALYDKERILEYLIDTWREQFDDTPDFDHLLFTAAIHGNQHSVRYLLEQGANPNHLSHDFEPLLRVAATHDHQETLALLIEYGADIEATTANGSTALHGAAEKGARGVALLLEHGADPNVRATNGYTPLHVAARHGHADAAQVLLDHNADPKAVAETGETPEDIALGLGYVDVIKVLRGVRPVDSDTASDGTMPVE